jgi:hypothetical protein
MQAITTKFHGPTDHKGARITARCDAGRITIPYEYGASQDGAHDAAAQALIAKLDWNKHGRAWIRGHLPGNDGCVYVVVLSTASPDDGETPHRMLSIVRSALLAI